MGKVTSPNGSSPSSSTTERSKTGNGTTIQPAAVISRAGTSAFKTRPSAPKPQINLGASRVLQQLSEINRRMGAGNIDPNLIAPMESQRNALIEELEQNTSVLVTHRSDGTIRIRSLEGSVLLDSGLGSDAGEPQVALPSLGAEATDSRTASDVARAVYAQVAASAGESVENLPSGGDVSMTPIETALDPVPSIGTVQQRIAALDQLAVSLTQSSVSLSAATEQGTAVASLISAETSNVTGNPYSPSNTEN